ncbi:MAG: hypothetical protein QOH43_577 [Solirubrobacteraceae bacterium]|jgi:hypothetical protein|nr:hypothetical protein [Solirubrobacteraceae bacterium]
MAMLTTTRRTRARRRWGRVAGTVVGAAVMGTVAAPAAEAKVWFNDLQGRELRWDQRASSTISNCPGNPSCRAAVEGVAVYLHRGPLARTAATRRDLRSLGRISASGTLTFRVPRVAAGRYHLVAWSTAGDRHRWLPVSGTLRVVRR